MKKEQSADRTEQMTLEETFDCLEETMKLLEDRETSLEEAFLLYQKGMSYIKACSDKINDVEQKILIMDEDGELSDFR